MLALTVSLCMDSVEFIPTSDARRQLCCSSTVEVIFHLMSTVVDGD